LFSALQNSSYEAMNQKHRYDFGGGPCLYPVTVSAHKQRWWWSTSSEIIVFGGVTAAGVKHPWAFNLVPCIFTEQFFLKKDALFFPLIFLW